MTLAGKNDRMKRSRSILTSVCSLCAFVLFAQQDAQYTQYMFNMLAINPAYAGSAEQWEFKALTRHQWTGFEGKPVTQTLSGHSTIWHQSLALGGTLMRDTHGPVSQYNLSLDLAYRIFLDESKLAFGLKLGGNYFQGDFAELNPADPNDIVFEQSVNGKIDPQFGFGTMLYSERYFIGLSVPRLLNTSFFEIDSISTVFQPGQRDHFMLSGGYVFDVSSYVKFKPTALVKGVQGAPLSFDLSANFLLYETLWLGAMYRHQDAVGVLAQFEFKQGFSAGYAYDLTLSDLRTYSGGSHEIMIGYRLGDPIQGIRSPRYF